ncbi:hypothetical protein [Dyadobacter psychrophilus]|uniref:O-antigen ligase like membrane protein n=1 Tax=Dyadobacter psychrophilus TaxID=651661 RepID=A0A1T5HEG3_9BACT|nr:hypothetical protein [Dyadobacter psychrophilus]SKC18970.1 hypothetical protein SAMN05660293_05390 [Dyadobacter psychrophilus]
MITVPSYNKQASRLNIAYIFLLVLFSLNFFSAKYAASGLLKNLSYGTMLMAIVISLPSFFKISDGQFSFPIKMISISIICSIFMAYISWGQEFSYSVSTVPYLLWFVFFYLVQIQFPTNKIENTTLIYGVAYIILYFFQFTHSDVVYFGFKEEFSEDRGIIRINFPGAGIFFLAYFIALNKVSEKTKLRPFLIIFLIMGVVVTVLQVTRQSIALILLITIYHFVKNVSLVKKIAIVLAFAICGAIFLSFDLPIFQGLAETQKETVSDGSKYIRVLAGEFFLNDFSPNMLSRIFGNGFPNFTSNYGKYMLFLSDTYGFYITDIGLIGVYVMFGIFALIGYLIIFLKTITLYVSPDFYYVKYYMWLLMVTCLTSDACFSINFMISNVFALYCFHVACQQHRANLQIQKHLISESVEPAA